MMGFLQGKGDPLLESLSHVSCAAAALLDIRAGEKPDHSESSLKSNLNTHIIIFKISLF